MSEGEVAIKALGWSQFFFAMKAGAALCIFLTGLFGSAVAFTPLVAQHFHERAQKRELAAEGLTRTIWLEPEKKLRKTFSKRELTGDLVLFERVASDTGSVSLVEAILKRGTKTVAVAEVLALDAKDSWSFGSATEMSDNAPTPETYSLSEAIQKSEIPERLIDAGDEPVDVIAIGINSRIKRALTPNEASNPEQAPTIQASPSLSLKRAQNLADEFHATLGFLTKTKPVKYWALDLGVSRSAAVRDSQEEVRQRAAIVVALSRRLTTEGSVSQEEALAAITTNISILNTDLTNFEHSASPGSHLYQR